MASPTNKRTRSPGAHKRRSYRTGRGRNACGERVRSLRLEAELTQDGLAAACQRAGWDIDRIIIAKIEMSEREVTDLELKLLSKVLRRTPNDLLM